MARKSKIEPSAQLSQVSRYASLAATKLKAALGFSKNHRDVYPVVVAALMPVLIFWSGSNIQELTLSLMSRLLIFVCVSALLVYGVLYFVMGRDKYKASLLAIVTVLFMFSYGGIYDLFETITVRIFGAKSDLTSRDSFLPALLILYFLTALLIKHKLKFSKVFRNYLAIFATVLLLYNFFPVVRHWVTNYGLSDLEFGVPVEAAPLSAGKAPPDIYYLIFDRYANRGVLQESYKYDNSPFLDSLKEKGFYEAPDSIANYPATSFSVSSSLNLDFLPEEFKNRPENGLFTNLLHNKIENNRVVPFLQERGYSFTNIGPWWNATKYNQHADQDLYNPAGFYLLNKKIDLQEHENILFQKTIFFRLSRKLLQIGDFKLYGRTYPDNDTTGRAIHRQTMFHQFDMIKKTSEQPGPKYVFAHFLMPHDPYVVDENCQHMKKNNQHEYTLYIRQLRCANAQIEQTVDYILAHSKADPIIIIQADEGPYPIEFRKNKNLEWGSVPPQLLRQKAGILNTYYFPDRNYSRLYPDISPVNSFRVVFNQYFGTDLPLLPDRHYFSESRSKRFSIIDVTDKINK
jgi:hypothetical protein